MKKQGQHLDNTRECPMCGTLYTDPPALSRTDNTTLICPECGIRQALESIGVSDVGEQDHIIGLAKGGNA